VCGGGGGSRWAAEVGGEEIEAYLRWGVRRGGGATWAAEVGGPDICAYLRWVIFQFSQISANDESHERLEGAQNERKCPHDDPEGMGRTLGDGRSVP